MRSASQAERTGVGRLRDQACCASSTYRPPWRRGLAASSASPGSGGREERDDDRAHPPARLRRPQRHARAREQSRVNAVSRRVRELDDIFAIQDEITQMIAARLARQARTAIASRQGRPTDNMSAYEFYLRALQLSAVYDTVLRGGTVPAPGGQA